MSKRRFISEEKMSKKARKELAAARRGTWGYLNPVTRRAADIRAYNRSKTKRESKSFNDV